MNDWELIQKYCEGSESAFETLVKRHVDYVYCAALRQVRDPSLAEDVSQAVFMLLAQKAKTFGPGTILVSWLFRATQNIATHAVRSESRRQRRELEAATMNPTITLPESDPQWDRVSPALDEALAALPNKDRDAVLLRFISRKPFSEVGAQMGTSEDAAKKRVSRALARLRDFFLRRGTTLSIAALGVMLGEHVVHAAPTTLATKIAAGVGTGAAASSPAAVLLKATLRDLFWNKVKWGAVIGAGAVAVLSLGTLAIRHDSNPALVTAALAPVVQSQPLSDSKAAVTAKQNTNQNTNNPTLSLTVLQSEDQKPIPGARVLVDTWTLQHRTRTLDANTDRSGMLNIPIPTNEYNLLSVWVSAEGRVPILVRWHAYEFNQPVMSYAISLEPGQTASGTVLDESGEPIPGATVSFQAWESGGSRTKREHRAFNPDSTALYTDVAGRWTTTQFPPPTQGMGVNIRVTSPAYAPAEGSASTLAGLPTNAVIVLSNGVALVGRISAPDGKPIPNAIISKQTGCYISTRTGSDGRFSWPHIDRGQTFIDVEAEGFEAIHELVWATNVANDCAFTLQPSSNSASAGPKLNVQLHGTVLDAETGQPIRYFRVLSGQGFYPPNWGPEALLPDASLLGEGHDGRFDWKVPFVGGLRLQIEADGYVEAVSEERGYDNANQEFIFKLRRAGFLEGRVMTPQGSPAQNAEVTFTGPNMGAVMQKAGQLIQPNSGFENTRTRTDHEGKFRLKLRLGARGIAIVHDSGTALLTFDAATNAPVILQPWGAVEGTLYLNGQSAPDQTISISGTEKSDADTNIMFFFSNETSTDARGHFRFDKALPCTVSIARWVGVATGGTAVVNSDQAADVEVESGKVTTVNLRRDGRPVIGRLIIQGSTNDIDWGMSEGSLSGKNKFPFALSRDGTIRADDVPPGTYKLSVELKFVSSMPLQYQKTFGSVQRDVVVPAAENESKPLDLGNLSITQTK